ncbi:uncharacterized protein PgNI_12390 [Pyricularia grisea]|uniref:Protein kinase domain-containing protein n=1 Tax=Pyricularia grisea TaxID=148305 RepID=A0A6P8AMN3_PYRGI|nr:uncharacterized protein PgNI_12390 [Pyricularia grisea]TLD03287.1 hypothetical protein PgNI_12390 [Pyricularia grisea]
MHRTTVIQLGLEDSAVPPPLNLPTRDVQQEQDSPRPPETKRGNRLKRHYTLNFIKESPWSVYEKHVDVSYKTPRHSCIVAQKRSKGNARVHIKKIVEHSKEATANRLLLLQSAPILFVPILEVYEQPSSMYLVYELVEHTLQDLVRSQHSLEIKELGAIVKQILEGLIYLEVNGVGLLDLECADIRFRPNGCLQIGSFNLRDWTEDQIRLRTSWLKSITSSLVQKTTDGVTEPKLWHPCAMEFFALIESGVSLDQLCRHELVADSPGKSVLSRLWSMIRYTVLPQPLANMVALCPAA